MQTQPLSNCMLLACAYQSARQRSMGIAEKNLRRLLTTTWQRKAVCKTLFQNKSSGTINPVYLPQTTPEAYKECVNQQNTVYHNSCPICFILQLWRKIPRTTMTSTVVYFGKHAMERNASTFPLWTWGGMLLKGIFLNNF